MPRPPKPTAHLDVVRHLMGTMPDRKVAELCGSTAPIVGRYRRKNNIPAYSASNFGTAPGAPAKLGTPEKTSLKPRRSKLDPFHDQVGSVPDSEIAALAEVTPEAVRMCRRKHNISAGWRKELSPIPASPRAAPKALPSASRGYAVSVIHNGEAQEHIVIAQDIAEAAKQAVARAEGTVSAALSIRGQIVA